MIAGTHLLIADIVYKNLIKKRQFRLDWASFAYGNIIPDIKKKSINCEHTLESSLDLISDSADRLIYQNITVKEYSMMLGIINHFVCDYFCLYHKKYYWKVDPVGHGIYETSLHANFLKLLVSGNLNLVYKCRPEEDVRALIIKISKKYDSEPEGITTDINFSIIAAISVCDFITDKWLKNNK